MSDHDEPTEHDAGLPEIIEEGTNPGWRVRVGVSREEVMILAEADKNGVWFDTEAEMNAYVRRQLDLRRKGARE